MRAPGPIIPSAPGHPSVRMEDLYIVCSMDPAMTGNTFSIVYAGDIKTKKRYVLECDMMTEPSPAKIRSRIKQWTEKYNPKVWAIEKNAFQLFLTGDEEILNFFATRGIRMVDHYTGRNKMDAEYGVASMAGLFGTAEVSGKHNGNNLIELPRATDESTKGLVEQLVTWSPGTKNKQDGPMALWFAETQMRQVINQSGAYTQTRNTNKFATRGSLAKRRVINLEELQSMQERADANGGYL